MTAATGSGRLNAGGKNGSEVKKGPFVHVLLFLLPVFSIPLLIAPDFHPDFPNPRFCMDV
jgi:hypothetical protein